MNDDYQLLRDYSDEGSEAAFRTLVERHLPMVLGVARRATGDRALAEEIAQTTFVVLSRKASNLTREVVLSGWLYRTTVFVASRALRSEVRRVKREQEALSMSMFEHSPESWPQVREALDRAMMELGETDRHAILLRFWESHSFREVGDRLGLAEEAAKKRVARAVEKLRRNLARAGVEIGTAALVIGLSREVAEAGIPEGLVERAVAQASGGTWGARAGRWGLEGVGGTLGGWAAIRGSWMTGRTWVGLGAGAGLGVVIVAWLLATRWLDGSGIVERRAGSAMATTARENPLKEAERPGSPTEMSQDPRAGDADETPADVRIQVLDRQTGAPVAGARLRHSFLGSPPAMDRPEAVITDAEGWANLRLPGEVKGEAAVERMDQFQVSVQALGYAPRDVMWLSSTGNVLRMVTGEYVLRLDRGTTVSGQVVDDQGQPVANAVIGAVGNDYRGYSFAYDASGRVTTPPVVRVEDFPSVYRRAELRDPGTVMTDRHGRFVLKDFPPDLQSTLIEVVAVDGSRRRFCSAAGRGLTAEKLPTFDMATLREGTARFVVPRAILITGRVVEPGGRPVVDAQVRLGIQVGNLQILARTNVDVHGRFRMAVGEEREVILTAVAPGHAATSQLVWAGREAPEATLELGPEQPLRGRVVDEEGRPLSGAVVRWVDSGRLGQALEWSGETDAEGRFTWSAAPPGEVHLSISAAGYRNRLAVLTGGDVEHRVELANPATDVARVVGRVIDADTGEDVAKFQVALAWEDPADSRTDAFRRFDGAAGRFETEVRAADSQVGSWPGYVVIVTAENWEPYVTRRYSLDEGHQELMIRLRRGGELTGLVRTPLGEPARGASVAMTQPGRPLFIRQPGTLSASDGTSDSNGEFRLMKRPGARGLVVFHDSGYYVAPLKSDASRWEIILIPWATLTGFLGPAGGPRAGESIRVEPLASWSDLGIYWGVNAVTDADGAFEFRRLPEGEFEVAHMPRMGMRVGRSVVLQLQKTVTLRPGRTEEVTLGGQGRAVSAILRPGPGAPGALTNVLVVLRKGAASADFDPWKFNTRASQETARRVHSLRAMEARRSCRSYLARPDSTGLVWFTGVEPGRYRLEAIVDGPDQATRMSEETVLVSDGVEIADASVGPSEAASLHLGEFPVVVP